MKIAICIAAFAALVGTCYRTGSGPLLADSENVLDYRIQGNRYAVVVVQTQGMSKAGARKVAQQRAAEITVDQGFRYFVIEEESETQMVKSGKDLNNQNAFYGNMYQELIVEGDYSKNQVTKDESDSMKSYPALRVVFVIYSDKSSKTVDACKYTECN